MWLSLALLQLAGGILAANDWSIACHEGQCAWDVPSSPDHGGSASLQLWSTSPSAIADITPAAGWAVLTCSGSAAAQVVRIVCVDPSAGCSHLLDSNVDPRGRIVRLTDECGIMPFAQITHMRLSVDQTLPPVLLGRRNMPTSVYDVALNTDFEAADSGHEPVNFVVTAASRPDVSVGTIEWVPRRRFQPREFLEEQEKQEKRALVSRNLRELMAGADNDDDDDSFSKNGNATVLLYVDRTETVFDTTLHCQAGSASFDTSVTASADVVADVQLTFGIVIAGTLGTIPKLDHVAVTAQLSGSIEGALQVQASTEGSFSEDVTLFEFPLPGGIVVPEILQLGPAFKVNAGVDADLGGAIDTKMGLSYTMDNVTLVYPASEGNSSGNFTANDSPLQLGTSTNLTGSVSLTGHIIPELVIGIEALKGRIVSEFALSLDASATVTVNDTVGVDDLSNSTAVVIPEGACVDVGTAFEVDAGFNASILGFGSDKSIKLFGKSFDLYNTCANLTDTNGASSTNSTSTSTSTSTGAIGSTTVGLSAYARHVLPPVEARSSKKKKSTLTCPVAPFTIHTPTATVTASPTAKVSHKPGHK